MLVSRAQIYLCRLAQRVFLSNFLCLCFAIFFWRHLRTEPIRVTFHTISYLIYYLLTTSSISGKVPAFVPDAASIRNQGSLLPGSKLPDNCTPEYNSTNASMTKVPNVMDNFSTWQRCNSCRNSDGDVGWPHLTPVAL
jgi:hypothetical protein